MHSLSSTPTPSPFHAPCGYDQVAVVFTVVAAALCVAAFAWVIGTTIWDDIRARTDRRRAGDARRDPLI